MSKHTQKVHGKLNFLMVAVVAVIGAVSYLLIQSGTIDPSLGTSSGIKGVQKADKYVSKNDVVVELDGEEIQDVLNNPDFQKMIASGEFQKLASDEDFVKVLDNKDGIGILGDIFRSLEFVNGLDIKKGGKDGDPIQSRGEMSGLRNSMTGSASADVNAGENVVIYGVRGNPGTMDSGISGEGGELILVSVNPASGGKGIANKVSDFQKFMKGAEFQKFMKSDQFQKFMKSGADFQKFQKDAEFQKFMKGAEFQKFMKGAEYQKFMKVGGEFNFVVTALIA